MMDAFNTEALKLSLMGVTVTAASGDSGAVGYGDTCTGFSGSSISYWPVRILSFCFYSSFFFIFYYYYHNVCIEYIIFSYFKYMYVVFIYFYLINNNINIFLLYIFL